MSRRSGPRSSGLKTACVESRETLGGTCLNVGCIPSKALLHASELFEEANHGTLAKWGVKTGKVELDLDAMHGGRKEAVKGLTGGIEFLFKKNKVDLAQGPRQIHRQGRDRRRRHRLQGEEFRHRHRLVGDAAARRRDRPGSGSSIRPARSSFTRCPSRMVVIGGGVIGLELGSVWRRLGAKVTVVEFLDQILPGMDGEVRKEANRLFKKQGFDIRTSTKVTSAEAKGKGVTLTVEPAKGGAAETIEADVVLVSIGRRPNTEGLDLDKAGIALNKHGQIEVDHDFRTGVAGIHAIGDVTPGPMLAHKAEDEGIAVAEILAGQIGIVNHEVIPSVVYTYPEIAAVGHTEEEAKADGFEVKTGKFPMIANSRAKTNRDTDGFVKVVADARTDRVLGVRIIASVAGTMIAQAAQAMEFGATCEDIAYTCHAHPTHSEASRKRRWR